MFEDLLNPNTEAGAKLLLEVHRALDRFNGDKRAQAILAIKTTINHAKQAMINNLQAVPKKD